MQLFVNAVLSARRKSCASPVRRITAHQTAGKRVRAAAAGAYRTAASDRAGQKLLALLHQG